MLEYYQAYYHAYGERTPASIYGNWADTLRKLEQYESALLKYQSAIETMASNTNYKVILYGNWGYTLAKLEKFSEAEEKYKLAKMTKEIKMKQVLYSWVYAFWAESLQKQEKWAEALEIYQEAAKKHHKLPQWMLKAWGSTLKQLGYPNKNVLVYYKHYVKTNPKQASTYHAWGNVLRAIGQPRKALSKYKRAVALSANRPLYCEDWCRAITQLPTPSESENIMRQTELTAYQQTQCQRLTPCLKMIDGFGEVSTN